jgi:hypothetical protein
MQADDRRGLTAFRVDSIIFQNDGNGSFASILACPRYVRFCPIATKSQARRYVV